MSSNEVIGQARFFRVYKKYNYKRENFSIETSTVLRTDDAIRFLM